MTTINDLPPEILVHIFSFYVLTEKQSKLVRTLGNVCRTWENASKNSQLWKIFDGTLPYELFLQKCCSGELQNTQKVIISKVNKETKRTKDDYDIIYSNLPNLKKIDFSQVEMLSDLYFTQLQKYCTRLSEIVLSNKFTSPRKYPLSSKIFNFLRVCGSNITHFDMSYSFISNVYKLFLCVSYSCPNLEELVAKDIERACGYKVFPIEVFQKKCSKLRVLCLGYPIRYGAGTGDSANGFSELEVFTHECVGASSFTDDVINKLLFLSTKLKVLDLRGCLALSAEALLSLPATDLQKLYISQTNISYSDSLIHLLNKWQHSLVELDLSRDGDTDGLNFFPWSSMKCLKILKFAIRWSSSIELETYFKNCGNINTLIVQGCKRTRRR